MTDEPDLAAVGDLVTEDPITPVSIVHACDEICEGDRVVQRYNHLDYGFERDGVRMRARAYLDDIGKVSIYPPFASAAGPLQTVEAPTLRDDVIGYLKRRYALIQEMSLKDEGYRTVWRRGDAAP